MKHLKAVLWTLLLLCGCGFAADLDANADPKVKEQLDAIDGIIHEKQVPQKYKFLIELLGSSPSDKVQYKSMCALKTFVSVDVRDELMKLLRAKSFSGGRGATIWLALLAQSAVVEDAQINVLLDRADDYEFLFSLAGNVEISQKTRERILGFSTNTSKYMSEYVIDFIRTECGNNRTPEEKGRKQIPPEVRDRHIELLKTYTGVKYAEITQRHAAELLAQLGDKLGFQVLTRLYAADYNALKQKNKPLGPLFDSMAGSYMQIGKIKDTKVPANEALLEAAILKMLEEFKAKASE